MARRLALPISCNLADWTATDKSADLARSLASRGMGELAELAEYYSFIAGRKTANLSLRELLRDFIARSDLVQCSDSYPEKYSKAFSALSTFLDSNGVTKQYGGRNYTRTLWKQIDSCLGVQLGYSKTPIEKPGLGLMLFLRNLSAWASWRLYYKLCAREGK